MFQQKNCQEKKACLNKYSNRLVFFMPKAFNIHYSIFNSEAYGWGEASYFNFFIINSEASSAA